MALDCLQPKASLLQSPYAFHQSSLRLVHLYYCILVLKDYIYLIYLFSTFSMCCKNTTVLRKYNTSRVYQCPLTYSHFLPFFKFYPLIFLCLPNFTLSYFQGSAPHTFIIPSLPPGLNDNHSHPGQQGKLLVSYLSC